MTTFPDAPISSQAFMEDFIPAFFNAVEVPPENHDVDLKVGVVLKPAEGGEPDPGGAWTLHFASGALAVARDREEACEITVVQNLADWRAALWEGRPALVADGVSALREGGADALAPPEAGAPRTPAEIKGFSDIQGLIELVISDPAASDWRMGIRVGAGPIPEEPQATILLGAEQAELIRVGDLHPLEALMSGQLRLEGDLGLILQLQAVAMTASAAAGGR
ncbi:MAG: SCP2 sterol-binding domain-containing protein [Myxococcota bacterium]